MIWVWTPKLTQSRIGSAMGLSLKLTRNSEVGSTLQFIEQVVFRDDKHVHEGKEPWSSVEM